MTQQLNTHQVPHSLAKDIDLPKRDFSYETPVLLFMIIVLSLLDLIFTLHCIGYWGIYELNPLASTLITEGSLFQLVALKVCMVTIAVSILYTLRSGKLAFNVALIETVTHVGLIGYWIYYYSVICYEFGGFPSPEMAAQMRALIANAAG